jgi:hypothetical protein
MHYLAKPQNFHEHGYFEKEQMNVKKKRTKSQRQKSTPVKVVYFQQLHDYVSDRMLKKLG